MTSNISTVSGVVANGHQTVHHVSASPPAIPDGRISRVRFWPWLMPLLPSRYSGSLNAGPCIPHTLSVYK